MQLEDWYRQYGHAVQARCLRLLGSRAEAEDAMQEVFLRVRRRMPEPPPDVPLLWLYRIADNYCVDVIKRRRWQGTDADSQQALKAQVEQGSDPSTERDRLVAQLLSACAAPVQEVARLYFLDELTQDEVAEAVGCSRKTVKERLATFRKMASELLEHQPGRVTESA